MHHLGARALARALSIQTAALQKLDFRWFLKYGRAEARFPRAQPRARPYSARQSIVLTMRMILNILIVSVALKLAEINRLEVTKKINTFTPPFPERTAKSTARLCFESNSKGRRNKKRKNQKIVSLVTYGKFGSVKNP